MAITFIVVDKNSRYFYKVEDLFKKVITPLYGDQEAALQKIGRGEDRICEMMFDDNLPKGIIIYKKQSEKDSNNHSYLELKTLSLLDPSKDSGHGYGNALLQRVMLIARMRSAVDVKVTVSGNSNVVEFYKKSNFKVDDKKTGYYVANVDEYFLTRQLTPVSSPNASPIPKKYFDLSIFSATNNRPTQSISRPSSNLFLKRERDNSAEVRFDSKKQKTFTPSKRECTLNDKYLQLIAQGSKTYEGRVNTHYFKPYAVEDTVVWKSHKDQVETRIVDRKEFGSFRAMLEEIGYQKLVPNARNLEDAVRIYNDIPGYAEKSRKFGVVAFKIDVVNKELTKTSSEGRTLGFSNTYGR